VFIFFPVFLLLDSIYALIAEGEEIGNGERFVGNRAVVVRFEFQTEFGGLGDIVAIYSFEGLQHCIRIDFDAFEDVLFYGCGFLLRLLCGDGKFGYPLLRVHELLFVSYFVVDF
jgi:hypothetical protein